MSYEDTVLLKLRRDYSHDEACKFLFDEIAKLKFNIGELTSEKHELEDLVYKYRQQTPPEPKKPKKQFKEVEWSKDEYVQSLEKGMVTLQNNNSRIGGERNKWREMYFNLLAQNNKNEKK